MYINLCVYIYIYAYVYMYSHQQSAAKDAVPRVPNQYPHKHPLVPELQPNSESESELASFCNIIKRSPQETLEAPLSKKRNCNIDEHAYWDYVLYEGTGLEVFSAAPSRVWRSSSGWPPVPGLWALRIRSRWQHVAVSRKGIWNPL